MLNVLNRFHWHVAELHNTGRVWWW